MEFSMAINRFFFLFASLLLAVFLTFSCSSDGDDVTNTSSSSSAIQSSSSVVPNSSSLISSSSSYSSSVIFSSSSYISSSSSSVTEISSSSSETPNSSSSYNEGDSSSSSSYVAECTAIDNTETKYCSNGILKTYGSIQDAEGNTYKTVEIGTQVWMAENLNYAVAGSKCGGSDGLLKDENTENCDIYGRLYDWATAMAIALNCNSYPCKEYIQSKHKGVCPVGWHIPGSGEWRVLFNNANPKLAAVNGWHDDGNGTDDFGFSALPGGAGNSEGSFFRNNAGYFGSWWTTEEYNGSVSAYHVIIGIRYYYGGGVLSSGNNKRFLRSIRCIQDGV
jgi:uncharacterized protein (TIGR02145 family)